MLDALTASSLSGTLDLPSLLSENNRESHNYRSNREKTLFSSWDARSPIITTSPGISCSSKISIHILEVLPRWSCSWHVCGIGQGSITWESFLTHPAAIVGHVVCPLSSRTWTPLRAWDCSSCSLETVGPATCRIGAGRGIRIWTMNPEFIVI